MNSYGLAFVLMAAAIHPFRDIFLKGSKHPISAYASICSIWIFISIIHVLIFNEDLRLPVSYWPYVVASSLGLIIYYYGTLKALERGSLSVYYPIIRSSPLAIVFVNWLAFDQSYELKVLLGIGLVLIGVFMLQKSARGVTGEKKSLYLALLAMLGSAAYTVADANAMSVISPSVFLFYVYIIVTLGLFGLGLSESRNMANSISLLKTNFAHAPRRIILAGVSSYVSYYLILWAFKVGSEAAAVSAIRQVSIPLAVVVATIVLKEKKFFYNLWWASFVGVGVIIISIE
jgi:uncharacterized membrane protein